MELATSQPTASAPWLAATRIASGATDWSGEVASGAVTWSAEPASANFLCLPELRVNDADSMHARFYNPQLGRFLSVDPVRSGVSGAPQSWNRYAYTRGNPMKFVDRDGRDVTLAFDFSGSGLSLNDQLRVAYAARAAFTRAGVKNVRIKYESESFSLRKHNLVAPVVLALLNLLWVASGRQEQVVGGVSG